MLWLLIVSESATGENGSSTYGPADHPPARLGARFPLDRLGLFPTRTYLGCKAELFHLRIHLVRVIARIQAHPLWGSAVGSGRSITSLSMVERANFISCWLAPSTTRPIGIPCPSESLLRLPPDLPRSVGLGPLFSPRSRAFVSAPSIASQSHSIPQSSSNRSTPAFRSLKTTQASTQAWKCPCAGAWAHKLCLVQRLPLAAGAQDEEDRIGTGTIRHAQSSSTKAVRIDVDRQQRLQHGPQRIGNAESGVVRWSGDRRWMRGLGSDVFIPSSRVGYSDRLSVGILPLRACFSHARMPYEHVTIC